MAKQIFTMPAVALAGGPTVANRPVRKRRTGPGLLQRVARSMFRIVFGAFKALVLLPLTIVLALTVWLAVRLIRG